jgi:hypothetical protein
MDICTDITIPTRKNSRIGYRRNMLHFVGNEPPLLTAACFFFWRARGVQQATMLVLY